MQTTDDFIPWFGETGKEPPQAYGKYVTVRFRNGCESKGHSSVFWWGRIDEEVEYEIVAYKIEK